MFLPGVEGTSAAGEVAFLGNVCFVAGCHDKLRYNPQLTKANSLHWSTVRDICSGSFAKGTCASQLAPSQIPPTVAEEEMATGAGA